VTFWDFGASECRSINLFSNGTLGTSYLLTQTPELRREIRMDTRPDPGVAGAARRVLEHTESGAPPISAVTP
jgi:hypothetical protein